MELMLLVLNKPISNMIPSIMPNVEGGDSLIKEAWLTQVID